MVLSGRVRNPRLDLSQRQSRGRASREYGRAQVNSIIPFARRFSEADERIELIDLTTSRKLETRLTHRPTAWAVTFELIKQHPVVSGTQTGPATKTGGQVAGFHHLPFLGFTRAIKRLEEFLTLRALQEERNQAAGRLRGKRSTFKRVLKSVVADLATYLGVEHAEVKRFSVALRALPRADRLHHMSLQALAIHIDELDRLCGDAVDMLRKQEESHGQPPEIERSHIQDTNIIPDSVICNTRLHEKPADRSADINRSDTSSLSDANCLESNHEAERAAHKSEFLEKLGPERLYALASSEMQIHLDVRKFRSGSLNFLDFAIAAQNRLPELGIDHSAWTQAVRQMGEDTATMCVLILDASRDRPGLPVANPGGYLRGMTRAAQVGKLNIIGGLVGLSERKKG